MSDIYMKEGSHPSSNDGNGIEIVLHQTENIYISKLILWNLLTSSNFTEEIERILGDMNGIGAKACKITFEWKG